MVSDSHDPRSTPSSDDAALPIAVIRKSVSTVASMAADNRRYDNPWDYQVVVNDTVIWAGPLEWMAEERANAINDALDAALDAASKRSEDAAMTAALDAAYDAGRRAEREAVVAWMRLQSSEWKTNQIPDRHNEANWNGESLTLPENLDDYMYVQGIADGFDVAAQRLADAIAHHAAPVTEVGPV